MVFGTRSQESTPPGKWDPSRGRCPSLPESVSCSQIWQGAAPNGEPRSVPPPPAGREVPRLAASRLGRVAENGLFQFILSPLRRGRTARCYFDIVGSGSRALQRRRARDPEGGMQVVGRKANIMLGSPQQAIRLSATAISPLARARARAVQLGGCAGSGAPRMVLVGKQTRSSGGSVKSAPETMETHGKPLLL